MWFKIADQKVELKIFAKPNAKKTALLAISDQGLHIALHAKPQQGQANDELIAYLAKLLATPKSHITVKRGIGSRYKWVIIPLSDTIKQLITDPKTFITRKKS